MSHSWEVEAGAPETQKTGMCALSTPISAPKYRYLRREKLSPDKQGSKACPMNAHFNYKPWSQRFDLEGLEVDQMMLILHP